MKNNWEIKTLGAVCEIVTGNTPKTSNKNFYGDSTMWAGPADLDIDTFVLNTKKKLSKEGVDKGGVRVVPPGSVLMSCIGYIGKLGIAFENMTTNQQINTFVPNKKMLDSKFLFYQLRTKVSDFQSKSSRATLPIVNKSKCAEVLISLPPLAEQKRIVKILDEKFGAIEELKKMTEQQIVDAKELFESRLNDVFEKILTETKLVEMSDIYDVRDGTHDSPKYQNEGYPLVTSKNLKDGELLMENIKYISEKDYLDICKRSKVSKGDVLFAMIGTIGNPVVVKDVPNFAIKNVALFKVTSDQDSDFLRYYLMTKLVIDKMKKDAKGATQKFVGLGYLRSLPVPEFSLLEQQKIVKELDALSLKTKELELIFRRKIADLEELKKSYLEQAFSGNL